MPVDYSWSVPSWSLRLGQVAGPGSTGGPTVCEDNRGDIGGEARGGSARAHTSSMLTRWTTCSTRIGTTRPHSGHRSGRERRPLSSPSTPPPPRARRAPGRRTHLSGPFARRAGGSPPRGRGSPPRRRPGARTASRDTPCARASALASSRVPQFVHYSVAPAADRRSAPKRPASDRSLTDSLSGSASAAGP